jgi:hypothetical protein
MNIAICLSSSQTMSDSTKVMCLGGYSLCPANLVVESTTL